MELHCDIILDYSSKNEAETVKQALAVDDDIYVQSSINDKTLHATITSSRLSSLLHTLDDYLACVTIAEKIIKKKNHIHKNYMKKQRMKQSYEETSCFI